MLMHALCTIFFRSNLCCQLWFTTQLINKRRTCQMEVKIREIFQFFHSKMCIVIVIFPIFKDPKTRNWIEKLFCKALPFVNSKDTILANLFNLTERIFFSFLWSFTWFLRHFLKLRCHQFKVINGRFLRALQTISSPTQQEKTQLREKIQFVLNLKLIICKTLKCLPSPSAALFKIWSDRGHRSLWMIDEDL